jgi:hypothetical protein
MKRFSDKRQKIEDSYKKAKASKRDKTHGRVLCQGCFCCTCRLHPSHLAPRSAYPELIDDEKNIHWHCEVCHENHELGNYDDLQDGAEIVAYLEEHAPVYLKEKLNL